jgi:nitroreductase
MTTLDAQNLLDCLRWRYATKHFDPQRKISAEDFFALEQALVLSPSSCGLQPWKFLIVSDPAIRTRLKAASRGQSQITDASHLVVLAIKTSFGEKEVDDFLTRAAEVRQIPIESLAGYRNMIMNTIIRGLDDSARQTWETCQIYIALGFLLTSAAVLGLDACPMEGIIPAEYDAILGLEAKKLKTIVACALGYRSPHDKYATIPKVRFPAEQVLIHV